MARTAIPVTTPIATAALAPVERPGFWADIESETGWREPELAVAAGTSGDVDALSESVDGAGEDGADPDEGVLPVVPVELADALAAGVGVDALLVAEALVGTAKTPIVMTGSSVASKCVVLKSVVQSQDPP